VKKSEKSEQGERKGLEEILCAIYCIAEKEPREMEHIGRSEQRRKGIKLSPKQERERGKMEK
jgi:hypothetical protein